MPATWPETLPQRFEPQGFRRGVGDGRLITQMEGGISRVRRRYRAADPMTGTLIMSTEQKVSLIEFVQVTLAGGALTFYFPDPDLTGTMLLCRLGGDMPSWTAVGPHVWRVAITMEVMP